jgi:hypothetical protein
MPALDKNCNRDNFIVRRDWQKLRHAGSPTGTTFWLKYLVRRPVDRATTAFYLYPLAVSSNAKTF